MTRDPINLFYEEPDPDRWVMYDRYPRRLIRRLVRGKERTGGVGMILLSLQKGLEQLGVHYRLNDYAHIQRHPEQVACIVGKPHVLFSKGWKNPVIFGAGIFSHPIDCPDLLERYPFVKRILVPGPWMESMFQPYYHERVNIWPAGIDTDAWANLPKDQVKFDFLIYDKIRWDYDRYRSELIEPLCDQLSQQGLSYQFIRYGKYTHEELKGKLSHSRAVIFLCEHESQGQAYQQILSTGTPILAWDRGGFWQDPYYFPNKVNYAPVSAVPFWDDRCGVKFSSIDDFRDALHLFMKGFLSFRPRDFILENLTLKISAGIFIKIFDDVQNELK